MIAKPLFCFVVKNPEKKKVGYTNRQRLTDLYTHSWLFSFLRNGEKASKVGVMGLTAREIQRGRECKINAYGMDYGRRGRITSKMGGGGDELYD